MSYANHYSFNHPFRAAQSSMTKKLLGGIIQKWPSGIYRSIINRCFKQKKILKTYGFSFIAGIYLLTADKDFMKELQGYSPRDDYIKPFLTVNTNKTLDKCLYHDLIVERSI